MSLQPTQVLSSTYVSKMWSCIYFLTAFVVVVFGRSIEKQDQNVIVISNRDSFLQYFDSIFHWEVKDSGPVGGLPLEPASEYFFLTRAGDQDDDGSDIEREYFAFKFSLDKHVCDVTKMEISIKYCNFDTNSWIYPIAVENEGDVDFHTLRSHDIFQWDYDQFALDHELGEFELYGTLLPDGYLFIDEIVVWHNGNYDCLPTTTTEFTGSTEDPASTTKEPEDPITTTKEPEDRITTTKEPEDPITTTKEPEDPITTTKEPEDPITTTKEPEDPITTTKEPEDPITTTKEPEDPITTTKEPEDPITTTKEPEDPITTTKEPEDPITTTKEPEDPITTTKEPEDPITTTKEPEDPITTTKEPEDPITTTKEPEDPITTTKEPEDPITTTKEPEDPITTTKEPEEPITTTKEPEDPITTTKEPEDPITTTKEPEDPITTTKEPEDPITTTKEPEDPITTTKEPEDPITTTKEPEDPITTTKEPEDPITTTKEPEEPITTTKEPEDPITTTKEPEDPITTTKEPEDPITTTKEPEDPITTTKEPEDPMTTPSSNQCNMHSHSETECYDNGCYFCVSTFYPDFRCDTLENLQANFCNATCPTPPTSVIIDPNSPPTEIETFPLCTGQTMTFNVTFKLASHPVDIYVLLDLSRSMDDDRENLIQLSSQLALAVQKMSNNYNIGFGSHVDKPWFNFGSPIDGDYSFMNHLPLSNNLEAFGTTVAGTRVRNGADTAESQLDALFQIAECTEAIGWRNNARHILLMLTDALYHKAGDGRRFGLQPFKPNCALSPDGSYTEQTKLDYPSEADVIDVFARKGITPIFGITEYSQRHYTSLQEKIIPSALGVLDSDSANVVQLLVDEYKKIEQRTELVTNPNSNLDIHFYSSCNGATEEETNVCDELSADGEVTFTVTINLTDCNGEDGDKMVVIQPKGLPPSSAYQVAFKTICNHDWN